MHVCQIKLYFFKLLYLLPIKMYYIIELGYRKISWFISGSQINYMINHDILLSLVQ